MNVEASCEAEADRTKSTSKQRKKEDRRSSLGSSFPKADPHQDCQRPTVSTSRPRSPWWQPTPSQKANGALRNRARTHTHTHTRARTHYPRTHVHTPGRHALTHAHAHSRAWVCRSGASFASTQSPTGDAAKARNRRNKSRIGPATLEHQRIGFWQI